MSSPERKMFLTVMKKVGEKLDEKDDSAVYIARFFFRSGLWKDELFELMDSIEVVPSEPRLVRYMKNGKKTRARFSVLLKKSIKPLQKDFPLAFPVDFDKHAATLSELWGVVAREILDAEYSVEIVCGDELVDGYSEKLHKSCMSDKPQLELFRSNPEKVKLLILKNGEKRIARCLVWYCDNGDVVLDRVYPNDSYGIEFLRKYAAENGFFIRSEHSADGNSSTEYETSLLEHAGYDLFERKKLTVTLKSVNKYPYMDTFCYAKEYMDRGETVLELSTFNNEEFDERHKIFNRTYSYAILHDTEDRDQFGVNCVDCGQVDKKYKMVYLQMVYLKNRPFCRLCEPIVEKYGKFYYMKHEMVEVLCRDGSIERMPARMAALDFKGRYIEKQYAIECKMTTHAGLIFGYKDDVRWNISRISTYAYEVVVCRDESWRRYNAPKDVCVFFDGEWVEKEMLWKNQEENDGSVGEKFLFAKRKTKLDQKLLAKGIFMKCYPFYHVGVGGEWCLGIENNDEWYVEEYDKKAPNQKDEKSNFKRMFEAYAVEGAAVLVGLGMSGYMLQMRDITNG